MKFGNERQTSLEGADAEQGVRLGIVDAAMRYDPTRSEQAQFETVAYMWARRNSRARHDTQKRAGVYAPSIESMGTDEDGNGIAAMVTSTHGACGSLEPEEGHDAGLKLDMAEQISLLPEEQRLVMTGELRGLSAAQIAEEMGVSAVKVRRLRSKAFDTLRESLSGYVEMLRE